MINYNHGFEDIIKNNLIILLISNFLLVSCASLQSTHQVLLITTDSKTLDIKIDGLESEQTPAFIEVRRSYKKKLTFSNQSNSESIDIRGNYRWRESFFHNMIFFSLAPIGWLIDILTGSAFELPSHIEHLSDLESNRPKTNPKTPLIAIAPPVGVNEEVGQYLAKNIQLHLSKKYPNSHFIDLDKSNKVFKKYSKIIWHTDESFNRMFYDLKADIILLSDATILEDKIRIEGDTYHRLSPDEPENFNLDIKKNPNKIASLNRKHFIFTLIPNTLYVGSNYKYSQSEVIVDETIYESAAVKTKYSQLYKILSSISFSYIDPPSPIERGGFNFSLSPILNFSSSNEKLDLPSASNIRFKNLAITSGYGGTLDYSTNIVRPAITVAPLLGYFKQKAYHNNSFVSKAETATVIFFFELAAYLFLIDNWNIKMFTNFTSFPEKLYTKSIAAIVPYPFEIEYSSATSVGLSLGYTFR